MTFEWWGIAEPLSFHFIDSVEVEKSADKFKISGVSGIKETFLSLSMNLLLELPNSWREVIVMT